MKVDHTALDAITDVRGIRAGHWTNRRAATGCTVVLCPEDGAVAGVDVRGGAPGTRETDMLRPQALAAHVHAVVLTGGSAYGLDAAAGVMRYLEERGIGFRFGGASIPLVPAAVVFDLGIGSAQVRPTPESGYRAARTAKGGAVPQGSVGAGTGCTVAKAGGTQRCLKGGLGTACERQDELLVGALAAVNAGGEIIDPQRALVVAGPRADDAGAFLDTMELIRGRKAPSPVPGENTTLAVVATNARLDKAQANRLASVAHDGFARAIRPAHTLSDGDTVFALATGEIDIEDDRRYALEAMVVRAVERAIIRGVLCATGLAGVPSAQEWAEQSMA
ncbi:MAG: P1 family peptidase [Dehalococcoidia bacterium]|nr:P1 family peptidase [Dehalococcoidia bacterium]